MKAISLKDALRITEAVLAKGTELSLKPLTVVILDPGGEQITLQRQDGSASLRPAIAQAKAAGALGLGVSSRKIGEMAAERPTFVASLSAISRHGVVPAAGGLIIVDKDDTLLGAVGVTGDTSDNDELCALAGIEAAGLIAQS